MSNIIYDDENIVAVNKQAGILTHDVKNSGKNVKNIASMIVKLYPKISKVGDDPDNRPGIVHRLDKDTSGVLVIAKNQKTFDFLKKQFQEHKILKTYLALVHGRIERAGIIDKPIGLKSGTTKRSTNAKNMKMLKDAVTEYKPIKSFEYKSKPYTLLELKPKTGRTHQLRVHLASIGKPIVGDSFYGKSTEDLELSRQFLHAESIELVLINGQRIKIAADLPEDLKAVMLILNGKRN